MKITLVITIPFRFVPLMFLYDNNLEEALWISPHESLDLFSFSLNVLIIC